MERARFKEDAAVADPLKTDPASPRPTTHNTSTASPAATAFRTHRVEHDVQRELLKQPGLKFSSLVIHRIQGGVCLEGLVEAEENCPDVATVAQTVAGVEQVLNHLVVCRRVERV